MRTCWLLSGLLAAAVLLAPAAAAAQSEMVIHKDGTKQYHRAGCPVIVGGGGVLAMTRAQAEGRGYTSHADCDPANPQAKAPRAGPPPPVTVYVDGGKYYHRQDCRRLTDKGAVRPALLETAGKEKWPCPTCKPPIRKRSSENAIPRTNGGQQ